MERIHTKYIINDLQKKMVFITGPRQVGKTWLAKKIGPHFYNSTYLNFDDFDDRNIILGKTWPRDSELIILDEIHKMDKWKPFIKGVYDNKPDNLKILVTGSSRLHTFKKGGDSLAGRFFLHRLLPFSLSELSRTGQIDKNSMDRLIERSGFPEPFIGESETDVSRWRNLYIDGLIREDILDLGSVAEIKKIGLVLEMLRRRVASPLSMNSIAEDLGISPTTVSKYVDILEALFIIFRVVPFSKNIARAILKEPKIYFFDTGMVIGDEGTIFENFAAVSLLKHIYMEKDIHGKMIELNYLKTKEGKEVDFCITENERIQSCIEVKNSRTDISKPLKYFVEKYSLPGIQLIKHLPKEYEKDSIRVLNAEKFFMDL